MDHEPDDDAAPELPADTGYTAPRWVFDAEVARVFDDMLERSIPQYAVMRELVLDVALRYVRDGTVVADLGCSRGEALARLEAVRGARNRFVGVEVSPPMLEAARARFANMDHVSIVDADLRRGYPIGSSPRASVTLAVLVLQFTPIEHRHRIVRDVFRSTLPGGALIVVEKVLGETAELDAAFVDAYHRLKLARGYSVDDVARKALALEGVLVPVTARWNVELLRSAGFSDVDCFWRSLNFAAWLAVRSPD